MSRHTMKHKMQVVLALDSSYMPMVEMTRRKALKAMASGRAHALNLQTWEKMGLAEVTSKPFHAVVFPKSKAVHEVKLGFGRGTAGILKRDGHRCQYVGCTNKGTTVDHVIPRCQGGLSTWGNLVAACQKCNSAKGGRTPAQAGMQLKSLIRSQRAILLDKLHELAAYTG